MEKVSKHLFLKCMMLLLSFSFYLHPCFAQINEKNFKIFSEPNIKDSNYYKNIVSNIPQDSLQSNPQKSTTTNSCNTSTFLMHLTPQVGQKIILKSLQTFSNGNFVMAANIVLANGDKSGHISKFTNAGVAISQTALKINANSTVIHSAKALLNDKLLVTGTVNENILKPFICLLNADLSPIWIKVFDVPFLPLKTEAEKVSNGKIVFAAQSSSDIAFFVLDLDGVFVHKKQISPLGLNEMVGIGFTDSNLFSVIYNCTRNGIQIVEIVSINQVTGLAISTHILGAVGEENRSGKITSFGNRYIFAGINKNTLGQYKYKRNIAYNSSSSETDHTYTLPSALDFNSSIAMDNDAGFSGVSVPQQGKLFFVRHFAYYQTTPEYIKSYNVPIGSVLASVTRSLIDGGALFGLNSTDSSQCILLKTDSIGILPVCGYTEIPINFTEVIENLNIVSSITQIDIAATAIDETMGTTIGNLSFQKDCDQVYCPTLPASDPCLSSYFKTLRSNSYADPFSTFHLMQNNYQIATTVRYDRIVGSETSNTFGVKLFDEQGDFVKGLNVLWNGNTSVLLSKKVDQNHVLLITYGSINGVNSYGFTLIDDNLQLIWTKSYALFTGFNFFNGGLINPSIATDSDGNYYMVGANGGFFNTEAKVFVFKMDANGNALWTKIHSIQNSIVSNVSSTTTNTSLVIVIEGFSQVASNSFRLDKNTGQMLNAYKYDGNVNGGVSYERFLKYYNNKIYYVGNNSLGMLVMGTFDTLGKPIKLKFISGSSVPRATTLDNGYIYSTYSYFNGTSVKDVLFKTDSTLIPQFVNEYDIIRYGYPTNIAIGTNGNIYAGGNWSYGGVNGSYYDPFIKKYNPDGTLGTCTGNLINPAIIDIVSNTTAIPFALSPTNTLIPTTTTMVFLPDTLGQRISSVLCGSTITCSSIVLSGTTNICQLNQPFTFHADRNAGCNITPSWEYDTAFAVLQSTVSPNAIFKFKAVGSTWIKVKINNGCSVFKDSILVHIQSAPSSFSLGNDKNICLGDTIILNAGAGFNSYQWQNGSHDSTFIVTSPGQYFVETNNLCGNIYRDTINILQANVPNMNIGNNQNVCKGDTVHLNASSGFSNYQWSPTNILNGTGQSVFSVPVQNEIISIIGTTNDGCKAYDTMNVYSISAHPLSLGQDARFCNLDSVIFSPIGGYLYNQYLWNNGSTAQGITVKQEGIYWLKVTDANGCKTSDTVKVFAPYPLPQPFLGNDFNICIGTNKILDAGIYQNYLWQDGSLNRFFTSNAIGIYSVKVTDNNGCKGSDSISLNKILNLPSNFLKPRDSVCSFEPLFIKSTNTFSSYLWSTGSTNNSIETNLPGFYVLEVKDINGCSGKDSINIFSKECISGIFVPSAFTPNADKVNDYFKIFVYLKVKSFKFQIYNRYGELLFASNDSQNGWDGKYKGLAQPNGAYVWRYSYLSSQNIFVNKAGSFLLLR
jgi:gliding motility-associated-like protein